MKSIILVICISVASFLVGCVGNDTAGKNTTAYSLAGDVISYGPLPKNYRYIVYERTERELSKKYANVKFKIYVDTELAQAKRIDDIYQGWSSKFVVHYKKNNNDVYDLYEFYLKDNGQYLVFRKADTNELVDLGKSLLYIGTLGISGIGGEKSSPDHVVALDIVKKATAADKDYWAEKQRRIAEKRQKAIDAELMKIHRNWQRKIAKYSFPMTSDSFSVERYTNFLGGKSIAIVCKSESGAEVYDIQINNGELEPFLYDRYSTLYFRYGGTQEFPVMGGARVMKVQLVTNHGTAVFFFE